MIGRRAAFAGGVEEALHHAFVAQRLQAFQVIGAEALAGGRELQPLGVCAREGFIERDQFQRFTAGCVPMGGGYGGQFHRFEQRHAVAFEQHGKLQHRAHAGGAERARNAIHAQHALQRIELRGVWMQPSGGQRVCVQYRLHPRILPKNRAIVNKTARGIGVDSSVWRCYRWPPQSVPFDWDTMMQTFETQPRCSQ